MTIVLYGLRIRTNRSTRPCERVFRYKICSLEDYYFMRSAWRLLSQIDPDNMGEERSSDPMCCPSIPKDKKSYVRKIRGRIFF